jgi:hypothetical protein
MMYRFAEKFSRKPITQITASNTESGPRQNITRIVLAQVQPGITHRSCPEIGGNNNVP